MDATEWGMFGSHVIQRRAIQYAHLQYTWQTEERQYAADALTGLRTLTHSTSVLHSGVYIRFLGDGLVFDDADPDTARLRDWLTEGAPPGYAIELPADAEPHRAAHGEP
jgi:hypothetical protein